MNTVLRYLYRIGGLVSSNLHREPLYQHCLTGLGIAAAYCASAQIGLWSATIVGHVSIIWPPIGIVTALLFRYGTHYAPWVWVAAAVSNWEIGNLVTIGWIAMGATLVSGGIATVLRRRNFQREFNTLADYQVFAFASVCGSVVTALNGTLALYWSGIITGADIGRCLMLWWLGDLAGLLICGPATLLTTRRLLTEMGHSPHLRGIVLGLLRSTVLCVILFSGVVPTGTWCWPAVFLPMMCASRTAAKYRAWPAAMAIVIITIGATYGCVRGYGPSAYLEASVRPYALWGYITACAVLVMSVSVIITERDRVEQRLRNKEQNYHAVVNDNPALICRFTNEGLLTFVNETFRDAFAITHHPTGLGSSIHNGLPNFFTICTRCVPSTLKQSLTSLKNPLEPFTFETNVISSHGSRWYRWTARGVGLSSSAVPEYHAIGLDVTDQKRAESQRQAIEAQALQSQRYEAIGVLAGGLAHEYNNIFTGVLGNSEYLLSLLPDNHPHRELLQEVYSSTKRAAELTRQLSLFAGRSESLAGPVTLSELLRESRQLLDVVVPRNCHVKFELNDNLPPILGDQLKMRQLLMSLITNAAEACLEDGPGRRARRNASIVVQTTFIPVANVQPYTRWLNGEFLGDGPHVCLDVCDTGVGMSEPTLKQAFDPFFTTKFPGRGLGLSAVLGVVQDHSGAISLTSELGRGTRVRVIFPAIEDVTELMNTTPLPLRKTERIRVPNRRSSATL